MTKELETPVTSNEVETPAEESETSATESDATVKDTEAENTENSDNSEEESSESSEEDETEAEESETSEDEAISGSKAKKKIGKLTKNLRTLERENERLRAEQVVSSEPTERPKEEDYEDYSLYEDALMDWRIDQKEIKRNTAAKERSSVTEARQRSEDFEARADEFRKGAEDYNEVAMTPEMVHFYRTDGKNLVEIIEGSPKGPEIAYYLGENPEVAISLSRMSSLAAAREIGAIESKMSKTPAKKNVSKAPTPINPTAAAGSATLEVEPEKLTHKEWLEWRRKNKKID